MSDEQEVVEAIEEEVETVETDTSVETEEVAGETEATETEADQQEDDEVVVSIGEETSEEEETKEAPQWVKDLRKSHRELKREKRDLEERLKSFTETEKKTVTLGEKPTLAGCDFDAEEYEKKLASWYETKEQVDKQAQEAEAEKTNQQKAWQGKLDSYESKKANVKVKDFADAEEVARDVLSVVQQGIILQGATDPALLVYAIGKNPTKAKELAAITDPVQFAFAAAAMEKDLKVSKRKPPAPEKTITGNATGGGAVDSTLERLRADAEKTGDHTKVIAYKRQKKDAA